MIKEYDITPVAKPRQTRSDKWKKRPCVMRYRAFADKVRAAKIEIPELGASITFIMPMPQSWSRKKKQSLVHEPHQQKPDIDNLGKALLDAVFKEDSHIYSIKFSKYWGRKGKIIIYKDVELPNKII